MNDEWIWVAGEYKQYDYSETLYINPETETVKKVRREFVCFNYHDEERWDEDTSFISVEEALIRVYPNEYAVKTIIDNTKNDYSDVLKRLQQKSHNATQNKK